MDSTVFVIKAMKSHQMCEADTFETKCATVGPLLHCIKLVFFHSVNTCKCNTQED